MHNCAHAFRYTCYAQKMVGSGKNFPTSMTEPAKSQGCFLFLLSYDLCDIKG